VVLCDGIGCDGFIWKYISTALATHHRVIHLHIRGHGKSPGPPDPERVSIEILADDAMRVLDDAAIDSAILIGHSMGVQTCFEAYRRHPERVRGMVLICGSYGSPLRTLYGMDIAHHVLPFFRFAFDRSLWPLQLVWRSLLSSDFAYRLALRLEVNGELIKREDMMDYLNHLSQVEPGLFFRMLNFADRHSASDLLEKVQVPVLLIGGEQDGFTPLPLSQEMAQRIQGASLIIVPGGTHVAPLERPELVVKSVEEFVVGVDSAL